MLFNNKSKDIGIDLGTANILVYRRGEGIVLDQPSVVALNSQTGQVEAVGDEAYAMIGRTSRKIEIVRPLKGGVIADFDVTAAMIKFFLDKIDTPSFFNNGKKRILICCPSNITSVERDAIKSVAEKAGGREVFIEEEPKVAAVGAGLQIFEPLGTMVVDIGGGTTDIAVLSMGDIVTSSSVKIAGDIFTKNIEEYIKNNYKLAIGTRKAEEIKFNLAVAMDPDPERIFEFSGLDIVAGAPKQITISECDIYEALKGSIEEIVRETKSVIEKTEPELTSDIYNQGIVVTGGGALIRNIDSLLSQRLNVPVYVAEDPLNSVANGTGILLDLDADPNSSVNL